MTTTQFLQRPEGRIAYDRVGEGPLVVLVPGMGDLRQTYRFIAPALVEAGYAVVTTDLRGHGDSDPTFTAYGDEPTAADLVALIEEFDSPAIVVGSSMAAGSAVIAAARRPELVAGLALVGPFVRNGKVNPVMQAFMRVAMAPAWAAKVWGSYLPTLYRGARPADFDVYLAQVVGALKRPGYARAFSRTTRTSHDPAEAAIGSVAAPTLVVMGELDPDFTDPRAEAEWVAAQLQGEVAMIPDAGHYPHGQQPDAVLAALLPFLSGVTARA
ncbi:alpha/beta fold hydrolase [Microbacterium sp. GXF7504]